MTVFQAVNMAFSMQPFPALFGHHAAQADSHTFILLAQRQIVEGVAGTGLR